MSKVEETSKAAAHTVVFVRHGQSVWNAANLFTGWTDVPLSEKGEKEALAAGAVLKEKGYEFDVCYTSVLKRAIKTLWAVLEETDQMYLPVHRSWRLNERHYGALQGLNKAETAEKHGAAQVKIWRRSYATPPPALEASDERYPGHDKRYSELTEEQLPKAESLKLTVARVLPYWNDVVVPSIKAGKRVLVAAHGNSLRALVKHLDEVSEDDIVGLNIPTGMPLVYELDADMKPIRHYYLADEATVKAAEAAVANQAKAKATGAGGAGAGES